MKRMLRRLFWLVLLGGAGYAGWTVWQRKACGAPTAAPEWPPLADATAPAPTAATSDTTPDDGDRPSSDDRGEAVTGGQRWVAPLADGGCPDGFAIKANDNSRIYHVPGGRFYDRTVPERCYARTEECEADGYRAAKS